MITKEKAIEILERKTTIPNDGESFEDIDEAFEMAIKALEQEPCDDAISRQAVLNEMERRHQEGDTITKGFIKSLPPVNPTSNVSIQITEREK